MLNRRSFFASTACLGATLALGDIPEKEPLTGAHRAYLQKLKRHAFHNGVAPVLLLDSSELRPAGPGRASETGRAHRQMHRDRLRERDQSIRLLHSSSPLCAGV